MPPIEASVKTPNQPPPEGSDGESSRFKPYWVIQYVRVSSLTPTQRLVLINMAMRASKHGHCWAGQERLSKDTGLSERTIRSAIRALVQAGLLRRLGKTKWGTTMHLVHTPTLPDGAPPEGGDDGQGIWWIQDPEGGPQAEEPERGSAPPATGSGAGADRQQDPVPPERGSGRDPVPDPDTGNRIRYHRQQLPPPRKEDPVAPAGDPRQPERGSAPPDPPAGGSLDRQEDPVAPERGSGRGPTGPNPTGNRIRTPRKEDPVPPATGSGGTGNSCRQSDQRSDPGSDQRSDQIPPLAPPLREGGTQRAIEEVVARTLPPRRQHSRGASAIAAGLTREPQGSPQQPAKATAQPASSPRAKPEPQGVDLLAVVTTAIESMIPDPDTVPAHVNSDEELEIWNAQRGYRSKEAQQKREALWMLARRGDRSLADQVLTLASEELRTAGLKRARSVVTLLQDAADAEQRRARAAQREQP